MEDNIKVMVRIRPLNEKEKNDGAKPCIIMHKTCS